MNCKLSIVVLVVAAIIATAGGNYVKLATKNLAGLHCVTEAAYNLQDTVDTFKYDLNLCDATATATANYVLDNANDVVRILTTLVDVSKNVCNNANYDAATDARKTPTPSCVENVTKQAEKLKTAVWYTIKEIAAVKKGNSCVTMNLTNLKLNFFDFKNLIRKCVDVARKV
uniref:Dynein heavy chain and region D6 of dynein motor n=1 Tax=Musca domestica TaxID=7370 RepID=T1PF69_MUSDO